MQYKNGKTVTHGQYVHRQSTDSIYNIFNPTLHLSRHHSNCYTGAMGLKGWKKAV